MIAIERNVPVAGPARLGPCPSLRTPRLYLRPHRLEDAEAIAASLADFSVARMLARVPVPYHRQDALDWLAQQSAGTVPDWQLAVCDTDGRHLGVVGLELRHGLWHLGYWLNRRAWGRGLMTEAVGTAMQAFFERMPEAVLHSGMFSDNAASLRVQQKLGFAITGCRDVFSRARNGMVMHIDTVIIAQDFRQSLPA